VQFTQVKKETGSIMTSRIFLIVDLDTGRMDGWYGFQQDACWAAEKRRLSVGGRWIVVELSDACKHNTRLNPALTQTADMEMDLR
jgi:hypothetical protein